VTRTLVVSTLTEADLAEAVIWYNQLRPGLGDDLVRCVEQTFDRILENPEAFATIIPEVRRSLVRRFPYGIFFRVRQHRIEVEAMFHLRTGQTRLWDRFKPPPEQES
jgi:plasmid stabilization system protein ParE